MRDNKDSKNKLVAVVSHDAGGAEVLSAYLNKSPINNVKYYLKGPAKKIFTEMGLISPDYLLDEDWDNEITYVLASMSWRDSITDKMIAISKKKCVDSEIILDSWFDYAKRFGSPNPDWIDALPTNLTVVDEVAERILYKLSLDEHCTIRRIENFHFESIKEQYKKLAVNKNGIINNALLFLSSPISEAQKKDLDELATTTTTKKDLLLDTIQLCNKLSIPLNVRLHPSEDVDTIRESYGDLLENIYVSQNETSLVEDFVGAKYVLGFSSLALIQASLVGKTAISFSKGDLMDVFNWDEYGVYSHYGINHCCNTNDIEKVLNAF